MSEPIRFDCPRCEAHHERGYLNGVDLFRCLGCGYIGFGHHPDHDIDAEIQREIDEANKFNAAHGLPLENRP